MQITNATPRHQTYVGVSILAGHNGDEPASDEAEMRKGMVRRVAGHRMITDERRKGRNLTDETAEGWEGGKRCYF
jgi:hypothetical protein